MIKLIIVYSICVLFSPMAFSSGKQCKDVIYIEKSGKKVIVYLQTPNKR